MTNSRGSSAQGNAARKLADKVQTSIDLDGRLSELPDWNHRILVVEDEHGIADAYRDILTPKTNNVVPMQRSSRASVQTAANAPSSAAAPSTTRQDKFELTVVHSAEQALAEIKRASQLRKPFTMGFFDVLLGGGMDGIELVKRIHEIDPQVYAVFVTAYSDRNVDSIQTFLGEGTNDRWDYLNKPFSTGEILQKARSGVAIWNMRRERQIRDQHMATMQRQVLEHERFATMATVARGIGHEFRNILTTIIARAEMATGYKSLDQVKETLKQILMSSGRAAEILKRFDTLSRQVDHKAIKKPIGAHEPIEEALAMLSHQIKANNVRVCWIKKKNLTIQANATALVQVYLNLAINAIHAMGTSGQLDISVGETPNGKGVEVKFRDFGTGIDVAIIEHVCEPFFTTKGENGTGLGLAISKEIIEEEHGGNFLLANHESKGLEVTIRFPLGETYGAQGE